MTRRFYREILLAAFLIMCNAAENFLPLRWKSCERSKISAVKRTFSSRSARRATQGFAVGFVPMVESPAATRTGAVLASLTFDGG
jgi:hypothetical protein